LAIKKTQMFVLLLKFMFILITVRTNKIDAYKEPVGESNPYLKLDTVRKLSKKWFEKSTIGFTPWDK